MEKSIFFAGTMAIYYTFLLRVFVVWYENKEMVGLLNHNKIEHGMQTSNVKKIWIGISFIYIRCSCSKFQNMNSIKT